jgi:Cof subfamily protein (haloacid dehalogenase superfamily)
MKAIITDLDRTLLHTDKSVSLFTKDVLYKCKQRGHRVIAATARPQRDLNKVVGDIAFDAMVLSNGARVVCGSEITEFAILSESAMRLLRILSSYPDFRITLETGHCAYSNVSFEDYESVVRQDLVTVAEQESVLKIIVGIDRDDVIDIVKKELTDDLYYTVSCGHLLQIMSKQATKWNGVKSVLCCHNISPWEAVYFGDDNDDIEPIKNCGLGVAVSNAIPSVLDAADQIADSNDKDGVAKFIAENIL